MLGDFNAMWHEGRGRLISSSLMRSLAGHIPHADLRYMAVRVADMATGTALGVLTTRTNLRDADSSHHPTTTPKLRHASFMPSIRLIQIDHMLVSPEINVSDFTIGKDGGSDHRAISATLSL
jgi:endonuclease/exonuclease/phosphatase family metal-dependent hydrolase